MDKDGEPLTECPKCEFPLIEITLSAFIPEASESMKAKYCIPCHTAYWDGILDMTKRKAYLAKIE